MIPSLHDRLNAPAAGAKQKGPVASEDEPARQDEMPVSGGRVGFSGPL